MLKATSGSLSWAWSFTNLYHCHPSVSEVVLGDAVELAGLGLVACPCSKSCGHV